MCGTETVVTVCIERLSVGRRRREDNGGYGRRRAGEQEDARLFVAGLGRGLVRLEHVSLEPE